MAKMCKSEQGESNLGGDNTAPGGGGAILGNGGA